MVPRLENRRVPLPHLAHHQTMNRPLNGRPHLQPGGLLWGSCELVNCAAQTVGAYQVARLDSWRGHLRAQSGTSCPAVHDRPK